MKLIKLFVLIMMMLVGFSIYAQQPALFSAVQNNSIKEIKLLLDKGADPNVYDDDSDNVLINAAIYASAECMKLLLKKKARDLIRSAYWQTGQLAYQGNILIPMVK